MMFWGFDMFRRDVLPKSFVCPFRGLCSLDFCFSFIYCVVFVFNDICVMLSFIYYCVKYTYLCWIPYVYVVFGQM